MRCGDVRQSIKIVWSVDFGWANYFETSRVLFWTWWVEFYQIHEFQRSLLQLHGFYGLT